MKKELLTLCFCLIGLWGAGTVQATEPVTPTQPSALRYFGNAHETLALVPQKSGFSLCYALPGENGTRWNWFYLSPERKDSYTLREEGPTVKADSTVRLSPGGSQLVAGRYVYPAMTYTGKPPDEAFQEAPYEMAPDEEALIGYYHGGGDVLLVREHQGELELLYELEKNDGKNNLHGGTPGYHQVMYQAAVGDNSVTFTRVSPDGEQGYPGNLDVSLTYTLTDDNELKLHYVTKSDKNTLCNLTNHSYFNLKGHKGGQITDHIVTIKANGFTSTSDDLIPDGTIVDVTDTPMDFRKPRCVGDDIDSDYPPIVLAGGYDHNYVLDKPEGTFAKVAEVTEKESGRTMEVYTDLPGMQLYSGNFIENEKGKDGQTYTKRTGICFETQFFPNSINVKSFTPCVIKAGETFESETMYKFFF